MKILGISEWSEIKLKYKIIDTKWYVIWRDVTLYDISFKTIQHII